MKKIVVALIASLSGLCLSSCGKTEQMDVSDTDLEETVITQDDNEENENREVLKQEFTSINDGKHHVLTTYYSDGTIETDSEYELCTPNEYGFCIICGGEYHIEKTITFGSYEQDNNLENGSEPILWDVISYDSQTYYLISHYVLEFMPYDSNLPDDNRYPANSNMNWIDCSLRAWLNNDFYDIAFTDEEKKNIVENTKSTKDKSGNYVDVNDKVGLLAYWEAQELDPDIEKKTTLQECYSEYFVAEATPYAFANCPNNMFIFNDEYGQLSPIVGGTIITEEDVDFRNQFLEVPMSKDIVGMEAVSWWLMDSASSFQAYRIDRYTLFGLGGVDGRYSEGVRPVIKITDPSL